MRRAAMLLLGVVLLAGCGGQAPAEVVAGPRGDTGQLLPNAPTEEPPETTRPWVPEEGGDDPMDSEGRPAPPGGDPDRPAEPPSEPPVDPGEGPRPEPELREPVESALGAHPVTIERFEVRDERTVRAVWWGGVEPCHVLADVEVTETDDEVRVLVLAGSDPAAGDTYCIMIALPLAVDVELERDLGDRALIDASTGEQPETSR